MRLRYNPKHLGDRTQAWKSFLIGSMITSAAILLAFTQDVTISLVMLVLIVVGLLLFVFNNMNFTKATYLFQNLLSAGIGLVVSLVFNAAGFLLFYLGIVLILVLVTWLHRYATKGKAEEGRDKEGKSEPAEKTEA